jgi:hypothetical protein
MIDVNRAYFPAVYRRFYRFDLNQVEEKLLSMEAVLREKGYEYDLTELPLISDKQLEQYSVIIFNACRHMEGDLERIARWLNTESPKPRILILNSVMAGQMDFSRGADP